MVAWQPEASLRPDECDDLCIARHADLMHTLKKIGELSAEWESSEGIVFYEAVPKAPEPPVELVLVSTEPIPASVELPDQAVA